jgi:glucose/mannose-6-phosphate isomerase
MSSILDSRQKIKAIDQHNLLGSVETLPDQIQDAWEATKSLVFPDTFHNVSNIIVSGMGGSSLGALVIKRLFKDELQVPLEIYPHYHLPGYTSKDSLVILSSYSGSTEETLAAAEHAEKVGAKIAVITGGGKLAELAKSKGWPMYLIDPKFNPCGQPRMAIGYAVFGMLSMFAKMGLINIAESDVLKIVDNLKEQVSQLSPDGSNDLAKLMAFACYDKHVVFVAAEHLIGAAHVMNNQFNENAKSLTSEWHLPEFNHHYMEALSYPKLAKETTVFFFFNSALYHERVQKRVLLTKSLIEQKGYETQMILATTETKLEQVFEVIQIAEFVAAYLPVLYGIDASAIPNVDWFKSEMAK